MQNAFAHAFDVKTIDDYTYILIQAKGNNIIYRDIEIPLDTTEFKTSNLVLKVDKNGNYIDHWIALSDCSIIYNFMRKSTDNELILFGQYSAPDAGCSNTTAEGIPFANDDERNSSILTIDRNLEVLENRIFFGDSFHRTIPDDNDISSTAKYVSYNWSKMLERSLISNVDGEFVNSISVDNILYPNPTLGRFKIKNTKDLKIRSVKIYNAQGVQFVNLSSYRLDEFINISAEKQGAYFVELVTENKTVVKKIIKL
jgi:hypothetical protein